ncbi:hypothetical protein SAMN06296241_1400 [Salinimicrobium sediminis]|uniref:Uncharacterized protein n=1 Tax=Salinimicrobium sediminis TaxID=1343891 RepID=A0A285X3H1_9FLAO|nr:hypothetical protein SAMN06296241_1400 [Salinimicrobium sediminis]
MASSFESVNAKPVRAAFSSIFTISSSLPPKGLVLTLNILLQHTILSLVFK